MTVLHHVSDLQIFHHNESKGVYDLASLLVVEVQALVPHLAVEVGHSPFCLLPVVTALPFPGERPLCPLQFGFCLAEMFWVGDLGSIGQSGKGFQADINTD